MRDVLNFIICAVILALFAKFFPELVVIDGARSLFFATLLLFVAEVIVAVGIFVAMLYFFFNGNLNGVFASMAGIFFAEIIAISMVDAWLPGVTIRGIGIKFFLAIVLAIFRIPTNNN